MAMGIVLQVLMIALGLVLLCETVSSLARRKMTESICLTWGLISVIIVFAGCLLRPSGIGKYISPIGLAFVVLIGFCVVFWAYFMSQIVSELMRKNNELAIQVSLLRHELEELKGEKTAVCDQYHGTGGSGDGAACDASEDRPEGV